MSSGRAPFAGFLSRVSATMRLQLGRLVVTPFATIGVLAAVLVWEIEHVGSILLAMAIAAHRPSRSAYWSRGSYAARSTQIADYYAGLLQHRRRTVAAGGRRQPAQRRFPRHALTRIAHAAELGARLGAAAGQRQAGRGAERRAVQAIERAGWAQSRLIEDLLDLSQIVAGTLDLTIRPTAVRAAGRTAVDALRPAAERPATSPLRVDDRSDASGPIAADPDRLKQIVWNLRLQCDQVHPRRRQRRRPGQARADGDLRLTVRDNGIGFHPEVAAHLFERFRQGDSSSTREHGGLGLGLGIVRHVVELHGGTVTARAEAKAKARRSRSGCRFGIDGRSRRRYRPAAGAGRRARVAGRYGARRRQRPAAAGVPARHPRAAGRRSGDRVFAERSPRRGSSAIRPMCCSAIWCLTGDDGLSLIRDIRSLDREQAGGNTPAGALTALARTDDRRRALSAGLPGARRQAGRAVGDRQDRRVAGARPRERRRRQRN